MVLIRSSITKIEFPQKGHQKPIEIRGYEMSYCDALIGWRLNSEENWHAQT